MTVLLSFFLYYTYNAIAGYISSMLFVAKLHSRLVYNKENAVKGGHDNKIKISRMICDNIRIYYIRVKIQYFIYWNFGRLFQIKGNANG